MNDTERRKALAEAREAGEAKGHKLSRFKPCPGRVGHTAATCNNAGCAAVIALYGDGRLGGSAHFDVCPTTRVVNV